MTRFLFEALTHSHDYSDFVAKLSAYFNAIFQLVKIVPHSQQVGNKAKYQDVS